MIDQAVPPAQREQVAATLREDALREELARGDAAAGTVLPILRYLATAHDSALFSEEILARVRSMLASLAVELLDALAGTGHHAHSDDEIAVLTHAFLDHGVLLGHVHALALEWRLCERVQAHLTIDPVAVPLLRSLPGDPFFAAQARWVQAQRHMSLDLRELPDAALDAVFETLRPLVGVEPALGERVHAVESRVRARTWSETRLGLADRLLSAMVEPAAALSLAEAGATLFVSALARATGQARETVVLSTQEAQFARFALGLRAAGLDDAEVKRQFFLFHPEVALPRGFDQIGVAQAARLLAAPGMPA